MPCAWRKLNRSAAVAASALAMLGLSGAARADWVPPFKGNDTGGIIAWSLAETTDAQKLATDHCARYGRVVKPLAAQRYYGGYLSFACVLPQPAIVMDRAAVVAKY